MKAFVVLAAAAAALAASATAAPRPVITFDRLNVAPGDEVTVHVDQIRVRGRVRVYLVPAAAARSIRNARDARLHYAGAFTPRFRHGMVTFAVPPVPTGTYRAWCVGCGAGGVLRVTMPAATATSCPATTPRSGPPPGLRGTYHGNGALWTSLPGNGTLTANGDQRWPGSPPGSVGTKLFWFAATIDGNLAVSGRRLDARGASLEVLRVNRGTMSGFRGTGTWATPVTFPTTGCWLVTARLVALDRSAAVNLSYVLKVELR